MGKRKRRSDQNKTPPPPPPSDIMPYSSRMDSLLKEKSSHSVDGSTLKSLSSIMDIMDSSGKLPNAHNSHQNVSRSMFMRHPTHYYGRKYSRRNSANNASSSRAQDIPGEKPSSKFTSQCISDSGRHKESKEKTFCRPGRNKSSSLAKDAASLDSLKMVCGICEKQLKRKPYILGNALSSSGDLSVVAVLVCGHVYHADCLEQRTQHEERWDPPCPVCAGMLSQLDASRGQE